MNNRFVTIRAYIYPHEAQMAKSILEAEGINSFLKDELTIQTNNFYSNALGGVKLQVPEEDLKSAFEILKDSGFDIEGNLSQGEPVILTKNNETDLTKCPFCGSVNLLKFKYPDKLSAFVFLVLGFLIPSSKRSYKCADCDKEWKYK
ncbi:MAG: DUF2007 domain-containing protein [Pelobium sp.]